MLFRWVGVENEMNANSAGAISSDLYRAWRRDMKNATFSPGFLWIKAFAHLFVWDNGVQKL